MTNRQMIEDAYVIEGEWSRVIVRPSKKGWIVETWSQIQGNVTGQKLLVPYHPEIAQGQDLMAEWNKYMSYGDYIAQYATGGLRVKILRKGYTVH